MESQFNAVWRHQAITWNNIDLPSTRFSGIHSMVMSTWMLKISINKLHLKFTHLKLQPHLPGNNELNGDYETNSVKDGTPETAHLLYITCCSKMEYL